MDDWIGYQWLAQRYGIKPVQALRTDSAITKSRSTVRDDGHVHEHYPPAARPASTLAGHLTFAFKHEGIHLEFLARLFAVLPVGELECLDCRRTHRPVRAPRGLLLRTAHRSNPGLHRAGGG